MGDNNFNPLILEKCLIFLVTKTDLDFIAEAATIASAKGTIYFILIFPASLAKFSSNITTSNPLRKSLIIILFLIFLISLPEYNSIIFTTEIINVPLFFNLNKKSRVVEKPRKNQLKYQSQ